MAQSHEGRSHVRICKQRIIKYVALRLTLNTYMAIEIHCRWMCVSTWDARPIETRKRWKGMWLQQQPANQNSQPPFDSFSQNRARLRLISFAASTIPPQQLFVLWFCCFCVRLLKLWTVCFGLDQCSSKVVQLITHGCLNSTDVCVCE